MAVDSDFKFGMQLGFANDHNKIAPNDKTGHGIRELPKYLVPL